MQLVQDASHMRHKSTIYSLYTQYACTVHTAQKKWYWPFKAQIDSTICSFQFPIENNNMIFELSNILKTYKCADSVENEYKI